MPKKKPKKSKKIAPKTVRRSAAAPYGFKKGTKIPKRKPGRKTDAQRAKMKKRKKRK